MMRWLISVPLAFVLVVPSCRSRFQAGTIDITDAQGHRTLHSRFHNGQVGKLGHETLFRAQLEDGSTVMVESEKASEPEEKK